MPTDVLICPDCGGVIGAKETTDSGRPCTCFQEQESAVAEAGPPKLKLCCVCGKDVSKAKRAKDSRGYWCYDCHKKDQLANKPQGGRCADCGRQVKDTALYDYEGLKICGACKTARDEVARRAKKYRAGAPKGSFQDAEKKRLLNLLLVAGVLVVVIVLHNYLKLF